MASENKRDFLYIESTLSPLVKVDDKIIKQEIINPITGEPYDGIILEGIFACMDTPNNNNRIYNEENYLPFVELLKKQIHSKKGLYGEYEHPKSYAIDSNNVSHKILDIWYVPETKCVMGRVLILNRGKGLLARDIIESGGQLAISARAAGEEIDMGNGTKQARIKLLVTYDLVYHPGFANALLDVVTLNESLQFNVKNKGIALLNEGVCLKLYESEFDKIDSLYDKYIHTKDDVCFIQWMKNNYQNSLNESQQISETQEEQKRLQNSQTNDENKLQKNLEKAAQQELDESEEAENLKNPKNVQVLNESQMEQKALFFGDIHQAHRRLKQQIKSNLQKATGPYKRLGRGYYDGSGGFIENSGSVENV